MTAQPMTPRLAQHLETIRSLFRNGIAPSYSEIQAACGLSSRGKVHYLLHALKACGRLTFEPYGQRSIRIIDQSAELYRFTDGELLAEVRRRGLDLHGFEVAA